MAAHVLSWHVTYRNPHHNSIGDFGYIGFSDCEFSCEIELKIACDPESAGRLVEFLNRAMGTNIQEDQFVKPKKKQLSESERPMLPAPKKLLKP